MMLLSKTTFDPKPGDVAMAVKICNRCIAVASIERPNGTIKAGVWFVLGGGEKAGEESCEGFLCTHGSEDGRVVVR